MRALPQITSPPEIQPQRLLSFAYFSAIFFTVTVLAIITPKHPQLVIPQYFYAGYSGKCTCRPVIPRIPTLRGDERGERTLTETFGNRKPRTYTRGFNYTYKNVHSNAEKSKRITYRQALL